MSSLLDDWWGPEPKPERKAAAKPQGRVHRCQDDEDEAQPTDAKGLPKPNIIPFVTADAEGNVLTAKGSAMPKGQYDRSKAKPRKGATDEAAPPEPAKRPRKPRTIHAVAKVAATKEVSSKGRFDVSLDLRGGAVTINAAAGSLTLSPDEVLALFGFMRGR
jgi:hypothetical protein